MAEQTQEQKPADKPKAEPKKQAPQMVAPKRDIIAELEKEEFKRAIKALLPQNRSVDRFVKLILNMLRGNPDLQRCTPASIVGCAMMCATFDLEPNTGTGECYVLPYKKRGKVGNEWKVVAEIAQFQIGYRGFIEIAYRDPRMVVLQAEMVYSNDKFLRRLGTDTRLEFEQSMGDRGDELGAFCYMRIESRGGRIAEDSTFLDTAEIDKIRGQADSVKYAIKDVADAKDEYNTRKATEKRDELPWFKWRGPMAMKSAIKRQFKKYPLSPQLSAAIALDDAAELGRVDYGKIDTNAAKGLSQGDTGGVIEHQPQAEENYGGETLNDVDMTASQDEDRREPVESAGPERRSRAKGQSAAAFGEE